GMMDCKKALTESNGDISAAIDWLRKKGLATAAKKAGRVASDGLIGVCVEGDRGAIVEVNSETDFVARNDDFQVFTKDAAALALVVDGDVDALKHASYPNTGKDVEGHLAALVGKIGENMSLRRSACVKVKKGVVASYIHNAVVPNLGKIAVLVGLESDGDTEKLRNVGRQVAMHVAAAGPQFLSVSDVDAGSLDRERSILTEQAKASGKPENIIAKMVEGRLRKFYEEVVLEEQVFVVDGESKIKKFIESSAKDIGSDIKISSFTRFVLGEGIEKKEENFAAEVAATAAGK
ncbi:MAG: elongation factor Ts, partial [Alphaproteobacteria bacterium]|nr:elongation factor Ts [Alphaproteobacteria bacterium]